MCAARLAGEGEEKYSKGGLGDGDTFVEELIVNLNA
jgi:hypothetical protein